MDPQGRTVEQKLAWLATRAHGIVDREELLAAGLSVTQLRDRVRKGALIREAYSYGDVEERPAWMLSELGTLLQAQRPQPPAVVTEPPRSLATRRA